MKIVSLLVLICCLACSRGNDSMLSRADLAFLRELTQAVVDSSRVFPGQELPPGIRHFGPNNSGITLIKPGGRDCYPSFWIRDYAMSLESGFITPAEQLDILLFTAARQSDSTWITRTGSLVPRGSIADHIRMSDGLPVYFPGTYDAVMQGNEVWRMPPYCDQFYFIHMAWYYATTTRDYEILSRLINDIVLTDRLILAFDAVPADDITGMAVIFDSLPTCDFGFRDVIGMTGQVCFGSLLRYRSAIEIKELLLQAGDVALAGKYGRIAERIRSNLVPVFADERGMLRASTGKSSQPDVWATAFAVFIGALDGDDERKAGSALAEAYRMGTLAMEGQIRHVLTSDDFDATTAWEKSLAGKNTYQNGAYWGTPTGWVCQAMQGADPEAAGQLAKEFVDHLRKSDFRIKGTGNGGPWECMYPPTGHQQNPVYMTTVTVPYAVFRTE